MCNDVNVRLVNPKNADAKKLLVCIYQSDLV